jgi:putative ABC transport system permease protein
MRTFSILVAEIGYRKLNFAGAVLAVIVASALFVAGPILVDGYSRETHLKLEAAQQKTAEAAAQLADETRRLMIGMGFNLVIVPKDTNMADFWADDFAAAEMPQEYVDRLAKDKRLTFVTHLVATLQGRITWQNRKVLLVGYLPETPQAHAPKKKAMGLKIERGTVVLGHELGAGHKAGQTVEILGKTFRVAEVQEEKGSKEDITLAVHLEDAQAVLGKPGRINQIMALECNCPGMELAGIRRQVETILPGTRVTEFRSIALARAEQRDAVERQGKAEMENLQNARSGVQNTLETLAGVVTPLVVLGCAVWIGLLAWSNVRQRREEIGLWRALGKRSAMIAALLLGKAVLLGLIGGGIGFLIGTGLAAWLGSRALEVPTAQVALRPDMLVACLAGAPLLAAVASYLPALSALREDPAVALREQ